MVEPMQKKLLDHKVHAVRTMWIFILISESLPLTSHIEGVVASATLMFLITSMSVVQADNEVK